MWMDAPTVIVFSTNNTFTATIDVFFLTTTLEGVWTIQEGTITLELDTIDTQNSYLYQFSEDNTQLTLTAVDGNETFLLLKHLETKKV